MKVMLSAGEASGDLHGLHLMRALKELRPAVQFLGMGGRLMAEEGMDVLYDPTALGAFGLVEIVRYIPLARRIRRLLVDAIEDWRPDVLVLIDFPGFNMRLAAEASARGVKSVYYFSPSAWAWGKGRARRVAKTVTRVASVFPFEDRVYREAGADVVFVGHPLKDMVTRTLSDEEMRERFNLAIGTQVVALCPGSRRREVASLFGPMLGAAQILADRIPGLQFLCPVAPTVEIKELQKRAEDVGMRVGFHTGSIHDVFSVSDAGVIASGTATLEAALAGLPMVIVYKVSKLTFGVFRRLVKVSHVGLPNIVAGEQVVPELLQDAANPTRIAAEVLDILSRQGRSERIKQALRGVSDALGKPGAVSRAAQVVVGVAEGI